MKSELLILIPTYNEKENVEKILSQIFALSLSADILFIDDLSRALDMAGNNLDIAAGNVYNIGGGPQNTISIWNEFSKILSDLNNSILPPISYEEARTGDQSYYVSDIRKIRKELNWIPKYSVKDGITRLWNWCIEDKIV